MMGHFIREQNDDIKLLHFGRQVPMYRRTCSLLLQAPCMLKMGAGDSPTLLAHIHQTACHQVPEDGIVHSHHYENLKSHSTHSSSSFSDISTLCLTICHCSPQTSPPSACSHTTKPHHLAFSSDLTTFCVLSHNEASPPITLLLRPSHPLHVVTQQSLAISFSSSDLPTSCVLSHNQFSPSLYAFSIIIIESSLIIHCWFPGCITASAWPL